MRTLLLLYLTISFTFLAFSQSEVGQWMKFEHTFTSEKEYANPLYDLEKFEVKFTAPSGRKRTVNGFWDGDKIFKVRFAPDEIGTWSFTSACSNEEDAGLHAVTGTFICVENGSDLAIYQKGHLIQPKGTYHLAYHDGTPFLWTACTAWNGALKSTEEEWDTYLQHRVEHGYSAIQFVTTQWRGADQNSRGEVAYDYEAGLTVNPSFFQHMDAKVDKINEYGLIAAPVVLWALPVAQGRHLSPGYSLPLPEAVMLAKYIVARYGGHQVVWMLGGDGKYINEYEQRWQEIGRRVFDDNPPGLVAQHPQGRQWIGDNHAEADWLDIVGYQSSHSNRQGTVDWINKGPIANRWLHLPARPVINLEPNYEEIGNRITDEDVRNASYWSVFATPIAGITYGANGIWPWIREGEQILNHGQPEHVSTWRQSIDFPGSLQIGYLGEFLQQFEWWNLRPANELLVEQPGEEQYNHFISVMQSLDKSVVLAYTPRQDEVRLYNVEGIKHEGQWFNPRDNSYQEAVLKMEKGQLRAEPPGVGDWVLVLSRE